MLLLYKEDTLLLSIKEGNLSVNGFEEAEQFFISKFGNSKTMYQKVSAKFNLGIIYIHLNRDMDAKDAFEYVIQHGNKLYKVQEAKKYLEQLS